MQCGQCGANNPDGTRFCAGCGKEVSAADPTAWYVPIAQRHFPSSDLPVPVDNRMRVVVTDLDMPFYSLMGFMIKIGLASVPATIIVSVIFAAIFVGAVVLLSMCGILSGLTRTLPR